MAARRTAPSATPRPIGVKAWRWSAVAAGAITTLVLQLLLVMLGVGIGRFDGGVSAVIVAPIGGTWTAFLWWAASGLVAAFAAGWVAGIMAPAHRPAHALAAWAAAAIVAIGTAAFTVGGTATVTATLSGPTVQTQARPDRDTTGHAPLALDVGQAEEARGKLAGSPLAGLVVFLLGAGAAYAGTRAASSIARLNTMS